MSQAQIYTKVTVYVNGNLLTENADVRLTRNAGLLPVNTTYKGFAGFTQGAPFIEIEVGNAVPLAGFEYNPGPDEDDVANGGGFDFVTLTLVAAGYTLTSDGGIMGDDLSYAINTESKLNFRFHGEFADWLLA
jgi:hypothetical protein